MMNSIHLSNAVRVTALLSLSSFSQASPAPALESDSSENSQGQASLEEVNDEVPVYRSI
jgi:hypothetical protein